MKKLIVLVSMLVICFSFSDLFAGAQEDLFAACKQMDFDGVKAAVEDGADVNAEDESGTVPLNHALVLPKSLLYLQKKETE